MVRGFLKRGSERAQRLVPLKRATAAVVEAMEGRRLLSGTFDIGEAVVGIDEDADGSADGIVVGGTSFGSSNTIKLAKYDSNGVLQASNTTNINGVIWEMAVDAAGRIVAAGTVGSDFAVMRFNADLTVDTTFSGDGIATAFEPGSAARDLVIQSDGKIVVVGQAADNVMVTYDLGVARFNADGTLDTTFNGSGTATADMGVVTGVVGGFEDARAVALDAAGRIVVAANVPLLAGDTGSGVARFTVAGALDDTFGMANSGLAYVEISPGENQDDVADLKVMADGKIVLAGTAYYQADATTGPNLDAVALARFTATGSLDQSFGSGFSDVIPAGSGISIHMLDTADPNDGLPLRAEARSLAIVNNRLVVAATVTQTNGDFFQEGEVGLFGLTLDGFRDAAFGQDGDGHPGVYLHDSGDLAARDWYDDVRGMAVTSSQILVVGTTNDAINFTPNQFLLARFGLNGTPVGGGGTVNQPPVAQPGGSYSVSEGGSVGLNGGGSTDADGSIVTYEWDFDYDGVTFDLDASGATPIFSAAGIDGPASRIVALRVTDDLGASHLQTALVNVTNSLPVASIGGNLTAVEGSPVSLTGAFADPGEAGTHATLWQVVAGNGQVIPNGSGASFGFTPIDDGTYTVTFTVTDDDGGAGTASVVVTVTNAVPAVTLIRNDADPVVRQWEVKLTGSFTDVGSADTHVLTWQVVDPAGIVTTGAGPNVRFTPVSSGEHTVTFTVTDDHGSDTASVKVTAVDAEIVQGVLRVGGTSLADDIDVEPTSSGTVRVRFAGVSAGTFAPTGGVLVRAGSRADDVNVVTGLTRQTSVYGGSGPDTLRSGNAGDMLFGDGGNDSILGNAGNDVLVGGDGDDLLVGGKGDDLLIGGLGADSIVGNANDDVIIGGWTLHDGSPDGLRAVHRIWLRRLDYATGVAALRVPGVLLEDETVFDDGARDVMTGEGGKDVFYGNFTKPLGVLDVITDLKAVEFAADLDLILPLEA
jgi:uncharacterized delta-60 repeat protein